MEDRYLSLTEARDALGISERTAYRWIKLGKLRAYKPGRDYRIPESAIKEVVEESEVHPKGESRSSLEPSLFNGLEDERLLRYLRPWRAFVHGLARRWEKEPPQTSSEIAPLYEALAAVVEQGVFEPSEWVGTSEAAELTLLTLGFQRLNEIANNVDEDEERNAVVRDIREKFSA